MATNDNNHSSPDRQTSKVTLHDTYMHTHIDEREMFADVTAGTKENIESLFELKPQSDDAPHTDVVHVSIAVPARAHTHTQRGKHGSHPSMGGEGNSLNFAQAASDTYLLDLNQLPAERAIWEGCVHGQAVALPEEYIEQRAKRKVVYLCFLKGGGGFPTNLPTKEELKGAMADIWADIEYVERGKRFSTIVVSFRSEEEAQKQASATRQTQVHNLVPEYCGRRNTRVGVRNISNDVSPWLVATFVAQYGHVVRAEVTRKDMWEGGIRMAFQVLLDPQNHKTIPEICPVTGADTRALRLSIQGRKPSCYGCGSRTHLRAFCPEQLEKRRRGKKLPEAAQPEVPPVGAPEEATTDIATGVTTELTTEATTREENEEPPPHTVDVQPVVEHEAVDPVSTGGSEQDEDPVNYPSSSTLSIHEDEKSMEARDSWQVVGGRQASKKRRKSRRSAAQPQSKTAKMTAKGKPPKNRNGPQRWGFTVLRRANKELMVEVKELQKLLGEDQVQLGKQMGECYQQQAAGRRLVKTTEVCHTIMAEKHGRDVGPLLPTITPELLRGPYGSPPRNDEDEDEQEEMVCNTNVTKKIELMVGQPPSERRYQKGFTVVSLKSPNIAYIRDAIETFQKHGTRTLSGDQLGPGCQQPAADRLLVEIPEYLYLVLVTDFCEDVGNWIPTITPELLTGDFGGKAEKEFYETEENGLVSWVTNRDDQG